MPITFKVAAQTDAALLKNFINEMYATDYEVRPIEKIAQAICNKTEIYILAFDNDECIGFSGASLNNDYYADIVANDVAVVDYIFVKKSRRNISVAYGLISLLLKQLVKMGVMQAIMQVQTFNKQRYFHYALSNKNIIKTATLQSNGKTYQDQILLIDDLKATSNISIKDIITKAIHFKKQDDAAAKQKNVAR